MSILDYNINHFLFAVMMSIRLSALFMSLPVFSEVKIGIVVTVILPVGIAFLIAPAVSYDIMPLMTSGVINIMLAVCSEILVGVIMGFSVSVVMDMATMVGHLTGMNAGLMMATFFDPNLGQLSLLSVVLRNFFLVVFFMFNIHHALILMLVGSYDAIPVGAGFMSFTEVLPGLVKLFAAVFFMSFRLVLPVIVIIMLSHLTMGIVQITAPQMNIYFNAAITLNIVIALVFFAVSIPTIMNYFGISLKHLEDYLSSFLVVA
ncbi:MAG: flagellar biosynthetic protein FliR [Deltaproteobacteria bacterium]|nr:flagellar biosynthetic protein FliR [Deltaproteobacteria bacterium]